MEELYYFKELTKDNYEYLDFIYQFTEYHYNSSPENFNNYLIDLKNNKRGKIILLMDKKTNKIIGAGTILVLYKIHNNPIGEIHDVFIDINYRGDGLGKKIVNYLQELGRNFFNCYKIILNCSDENKLFYEKCGFKRVGNEMKYLVG